MSSYKNQQGVWMIYGEDNHGPHVIHIFADVVPAAREQARQGRGKVGFWPFCMTLDAAIKQWEAPEQIEIHKVSRMMSGLAKDDLMLDHLENGGYI